MKIAAICVSLLSVFATVAQADDTAAPLRLVDGFTTPLQVDAAALASLPRTGVEASDHGTPAHWEGVAMVELLRKAGAPLDKALRGDALS